MAIAFLTHLILSAFFWVNVWSLQNPYCSMPCDFGNGHNYLHTVCERNAQKCGPGPQCGPDFKAIDMTDNLRQYVMDLHNKLRNKVASGNETRDRQPPASNMMALKYSKELEYIAQCWGNTCNGQPLKHDLCRGTLKHNHVGQNLGFINSSTININIKQSVHDLIMFWYNEVAIYKSKWVPDTQNRSPLKVGHYTQMLWAETDTIGCAITYYTSPNINAHQKHNKWHHIIFACNYSPGGNYIGAPVYQSGKPCTACPRGHKCSDFSSLCGKSMKIKIINDKFSPIFSGKL